MVLKILGGREGEAFFGGFSNRFAATRNSTVCKGNRCFRPPGVENHHWRWTVATRMHSITFRLKVGYMRLLLLFCSGVQLGAQLGRVG